MKIHSSYALMLIFLFAFVTCKKDKKTIKEAHFSYLITLSKDLTLKRVENLISNELNYVKVFDYFKDSIVVTQNFIQNNFH